MKTIVCKCRITEHESMENIPFRITRKENRLEKYRFPIKLLQMNQRRGMARKSAWKNLENEMNFHYSRSTHCSREERKKMGYIEICISKCCNAESKCRDCVKANPFQFQRFADQQITIESAFRLGRFDLKLKRRANIPQLTQSENTLLSRYSFETWSRDALDVAVKD